MFFYFYAGHIIRRLSIMPMDGVLLLLLVLESFMIVFREFNVVNFAKCPKRRQADFRTTCIHVVNIFYWETRI